jgi:hypothetical protein
MSPVTKLLEAARRGDPRAADESLPLIDLDAAWDRPTKVAHWRTERAKHPFVAPTPRAKW